MKKQLFNILIIVICASCQPTISPLEEGILRGDTIQLHVEGVMNPEWVVEAEPQAVCGEVFYPEIVKVIDGNRIVGLNTGKAWVGFYHHGKRVGCNVYVWTWDSPPFTEEPMKVVCCPKPCIDEGSATNEALTYALEQTSPNGKYIFKWYIKMDDKILDFATLEPYTKDNISIYAGDSVLVSGFMDEAIDCCNRDTIWYIHIDPKNEFSSYMQVTKQVYPKQEEAIIEGVIGTVPNPCLTIPCASGMKWAVLVGQDVYIIPEIKGLVEGVSVRAIGTIWTDVDVNMKEYKYLDIQQIEKI